MKKNGSVAPINRIVETYGGVNTEYVKIGL